MRKPLFTYLPASLFLAFLAMALLTSGGCGGDDGGGSLAGGSGGGGDGSGSGTIPSSVKSVVITGTVPGTVAIAYEHATGKEAARDVASGTPKTFTLSVDPGAYYLMFIESEGTPAQRSYAFRNVTGGNVFTCNANTTLDLGVLVFNGYPGTATPLVDPVSGNDNVSETYVREASFSPGPGEWIVTRTFVSSTCPGHSPGTAVTEDVTIAQGFGLVTYTPAGTTDTAGGIANVNTAILSRYSGDSMVTIDLTMQSDGSLAGTYSKAGFGGGCSEEATIAAVLRTSSPATTLTGLSINGPSSMPEYGTAAYTATAHWSDNSKSTVTPTWSVDSQMVSINASGVLSCHGGIAADKAVTITAAYSHGAITETATMGVTITHVPSIPLTEQELSGKVFFEEETDFLYILNADSTLNLYAEFGTPPFDPSYYVNGAWSNGPDGLDLDFRFADYGGSIVRRIADFPTGMEVVVFEKVWEFTHNFTWEKTMSVDPAKLRGNYMGSDGYTWVFNADGTGSVSNLGGINFTWSVDSDGVLRMPSTTGRSAVFYARATSLSTATEYTILKVGFAEHNTSTGNFYKYYGGYELTRQ